MRIHTRLGASVCLTVFSLVSIILLLPSSQVSTHLQKLALGTSIDKYTDKLWNWGSDIDEDDDIEDGIRIVVFGDSWVDDTVEESANNGKGKSWAEVLCEEINCTSHYNFAASQPSAAYPSSPPTGAITSNNIYISSLATSSSPPTESLALNLLPDFATQVHEFLTLPPPKSRFKQTIFVVSFGIWDIYQYAGLDYAMGQNVTDTAINELFAQLNILYTHYTNEVINATTKVETLANTPRSTTSHAPFRVVIPRLFDVTLLPGWISQRPVPLAPSSVAEQQKNAVYLTNRWNSAVENKMGAWVKEDLTPGAEARVKSRDESQEPKEGETNKEGGEHEEEGEPTGKEEGEDGTPLEESSRVQPITIEREVFFYDLPKYLLDIIVEHQLEDEDLKDASGLGTGESPFDSVYEPCLKEAGSTPTNGLADVNGMLVCKNPEDYMFWDSFNVGSIAKEAIGKEIGAMIRDGNCVKRE